MDMQDKEFDELFRSRLKDLEIEPSNAVWQRVNESLGNNKRKRIMPFLSIAASVIVLIAAGILFISKKDNVVKLHGMARTVVVKPYKVIVPEVKKQGAIIALNTPTIPTKRIVHLYYKSNSRMQTAAARQDIANKNESPVPVANNQQVLAAASSAKGEVKQTLIADSAATLATVKPTVQDAVTLAAIPDRQIASVPPAQKITNSSSIKKHGIRGIGDILNVVVAAVDKRKDKLIEFADSDGDGATVTGVNLGPIKVKTAN